MCKKKKFKNKNSYAHEILEATRPGQTACLERPPRGHARALTVTCSRLNRQRYACPKKIIIKKKKKRSSSNGFDTVLVIVIILAISTRTTRDTVSRAL